MNNSHSTSDPMPRFDPEACSAARQTFEFERPGEADPAALAAARRHVQNCLACQQAVRQHENIDARIGSLCRDVPLPDGLKSRLLAAIEAASVPESLSTSNGVAPKEGKSAPAVPAGSVDATISTPASAEPPGAPVAAPAKPVRLTRRRWFKLVAATSACAVALGLGFWSVHRAARVEYDLDELVLQSLGDEVSPESLPEFGAPFPPLPATMNTRYVVEAPRQFPAPEVATYFFKLPTRRGTIVSARLLAIPAGLLSTPPAASSFLARPAIYPGRQFCASTWTEGDYAYVILVKAGENELHRLLPVRPVAI